MYKEAIIESLEGFDEMILNAVSTYLKGVVKAFLNTDFEKWRDWEIELKAEIEGVVKILGDKYRSKLYRMHIIGEVMSIVGPFLIPKPSKITVLGCTSILLKTAQGIVHGRNMDLSPRDDIQKLS